ncbi:MAG: YebC/PmpR family DNA-binding transcriptional regulator [Verrucomicrobiota bacterium]
MAGHNKWSKVKRGKAIVDAKKGKVFSKFAREITLAVKHGGKDPDSNPRLRTALLGARAANMPNDNIDRALKKGSGEIEGATLDEITYEAYAPGGIAMLIECVTDNKNRASADVRITCNKNGGTMGSAGSVAHLFQRIGSIKIPASALSPEEITDLAIEAGADDVQSDEEEHTVITSVSQLYAVAGFLKERGLTASFIKLDYQPATTITLTDAETARQVLNLYDLLDDLDDTQNVYANFEISDELMDQLDS